MIFLTSSSNWILALLCRSSNTLSALFGIELLLETAGKDFIIKDLLKSDDDFFFL